MIPGSANPLLLKSAAGGLQISRSLRFNSADSAYFSRVPAVAGNRTTWTWSGWVKRSKLGNQRFSLFCAGNSGSEETEFFFEQSTGADKLHFYYYNSSYQGQCLTTALFRDPSAWYHIVLALDTTQGTASDRCKIYVNGVQQSTSFISNFGLSATPNINSTAPHQLGRSPTEAYPFDGYLTNIHFVDGQALTPSSFTETDATTGQLIPKTYSGSYGTNGFNLLFADNSSNTASTLGKDSSPNGNNWTPNNLSVTAGVGNDSLVDSPTNYGTDTGVGGEVRGNYCTLNPLDKTPSYGTLSNGNLDWAYSSQVVYAGARSTFGVSTGKWYFECTNNGTPSAGFTYIGVATKGFNFDDTTNILILGNETRYYRSDGNSSTSNGSQTTAAYGASYTTGDIIGVALNLDAGTITFYKNGTTQGVAFSGLSGTYFACGSSINNSAGLTWNFGQRAFAYTAPSGFKALCTQNLPAGTITTSGSFTGNANADGPFVYLNGVPTAMTINSNAVTFATHADKLSNGFKLRTSSGSYNTAGSNTYSITTTGDKFKYARAQPNP
jgi:hypothetical protein